MDDLARIVAHLFGSGGSGKLISGDPGQPVRRILFASVLTPEVVGEAVGAGADLLLTLGDGPAGLDLVGPRGAMLRRLVHADIALYTADPADDVVAASTAGLLELEEAQPLVPLAAADLAMLVVYTPESDAETLRRALADAGAGAIGDYTGCAWSVVGTGEFTPLAGADPAVGTIGTHERVRETRLEMVVPLGLIPAVTAALRRAHPYEEPAFSFVAVHPAPARSGRGRVGDLADGATTEELARRLATELPKAPIRTSGGGRAHRRIAVADRADQEVLDAAVAHNAGVLITSDTVSDHLVRANAMGLELIDVPRAQFAWPVLPALARKVAAASDGEVETIVSTSFSELWRAG